MTEKPRKRPNPERVRSIVFVTAASAFAIAFATISGGGEDTALTATEQTDFLSVVLSGSTITETSSGASLNQSSEGGELASSIVEQARTVQPKPQFVVVPFPRARSRAS